MAKKLSACTTISDFADYESGLDISHGKLYLKSKLNISDDHKAVVNTTSLVNKYYDMIKATCYKITLSNSDYLKYKYQPKLFCYDTYGTTELWSLLLKVNNLLASSEFTLHTLLIFHDEIFDILNEIIVLEETNINNNISSLEEN